MRSLAITSALAQWCQQVSWQALSPARRQRVVNAFIDTVGVAIAGTRDPGFARVRSFLDRIGGWGDRGTGGRDAEVWGWGTPAGLTSAAFLNATAGHILDFDDVHYGIHGHPSTVLFPALVAVAQAERLTSERVLVGYVAGVGVMTAVSRLYGPRHYSVGWHPTSTCGAVGAAAGVATALGAPEEQIVTAISAAVSMAAGVRANFGTLLKPLHAGFAARSGIEAAYLAASGVSAAPAALESRLGGIDVFGDGSLLHRYADPVDAALEAARRGIDELGLKLYPCCRGAHYAIDAALEVRQRLGATGADIADVWVQVPLGAKTALIYDDPQTGLEGKFSLPYAVATALAYGVPRLGHFTDTAVQDPLTRQIMRRLVVVEDDSAGDLSGSMEGRYAIVEARTHDGRRARARVDDARGSWTRPLTDAEVDDKFATTAGMALPPERARDFVRAIRGAPASVELSGLFRRLHHG